MLEVFFRRKDWYSKGWSINGIFLRFLISPLDLTAHNWAAWTKLTNQITGKSQYISRKLGVDPNPNKQYGPKSTNYNLKGPLERMTEAKKGNISYFFYLKLR